MQAAFTAACALVGATDYAGRETIAMNIISTAQRGIYDPTFLRDDAVAQWRRVHAPKHSRPVTDEGSAATG